MSADAAELARRGLGELGEAAAGIGRIHRAIATRAFGAAGPGAAPARAVHDAIARRVYGGLRSGSRGAGRAAAWAAERLESRPLADTSAGSTVLGILNGLIGDELARERSALEMPMTLRADGAPGPRVAVFVHGLMETDRSWALGGRPTYGARLADELGFVPVYVRYNTGRPVAANGAELAEHLEELLAGWPLADVALVGHSMGGLVARCAAHHAATQDMAWVASVRRIVTLGTPHAGAPLAQGVHHLSRAFAALPETRPFGAFLDRRSEGIRDLRHGVDCEAVPLLEQATHCHISATLTRDARHPVGRVLGDVLVLAPSAAGRALGLREEDGFAVGGANHFALLNHPAVYERLRAWLGGVA